MRTFSFIFLVAVGQVSQVYSQVVSLKEAEQTAQNFFGKIHKSVPICADISINGSDTLFYVFNADNAFVIISADKKAIPILAYSNESTYDANNVIPPVKMWLDYYQRQLLAIRKDEAFAQSLSVGKAWEELQQPTKIRKSTTPASIPLLTSKWGQGRAYNYYCPKDANGNNGRVVTGCVATAMTQLMYYFRFPTQGTGSYEYTWEPYGNLSVNFGNTTYDYSTMADIPTEINSAISLLMFHCGVAVDMEYGPTGSGMTNHSAADRLKKHFNFSPQTQYVFRDTTNLNWDSLIVSHIDNKIPLYYAGWSDTTYTMGHAFICDAYQVDSNNNYYYHFNFGWDGQSDGYFYTDSLYVGKSDFNLRQELIINAYPDTLKFTYPNSFPLTGTTIFTTEDGSFTTGTMYNCPPNMDYTWIIRPNVDDIERIAFNMRYKLAEKDTLFVSSKNGKTNFIFTYDTSTNFFANISDTEFTVRLKTTNNDVLSGGFFASYTTISKVYCGGIRQLNTNQGTIEDGSGVSRYNNFTNCTWKIRVTGSSITVYFSKFETEKDKDILTFRDLRQSDLPVLAKLSGILTDSVYTFQTNYLELTFETDEKNTFQGWAFSYDTDVVGMSDFKDDKKINIYPNPTTGLLRVTGNELRENTNIEIYDVVGKKLSTFNFQLSTNEIDISHLANGLYFLKVGNKTVKVIKND